MMRTVEERDLATIGARVELPTPPAAARVPALAPAPEEPDDRLSELASWWGGVAGTEPPRRVERLWLARPPTLSVEAEVVTHRFDAPADIPAALDWGIAAADRAVDAGTDLILLSLEPEDRDHIGWRVLVAHLLALDAQTAVGPPGPDRISDATWIEHVAAVRDGLRAVRGIRNQPELLLERLGRPALAAATGLLVQASARRTPILLDGAGAAAAALLAHRVARVARTWWQASDAGGSALHTRALTDLRLTPLTALRITTEDGTAAGTGLGLLEAALARREARRSRHA
jgi:hypothetical protein